MQLCYFFTKYSENGIYLCLNCYSNTTTNNNNNNNTKFTWHHNAVRRLQRRWIGNLFDV